MPNKDRRYEAHCYYLVLGKKFKIRFGCAVGHNSYHPLMPFSNTVQTLIDLTKDEERENQKQNKRCKCFTNIRGVEFPFMSYSYSD